MLFLKESWQPEKIEPPDGIGEKLGDQEGPSLPESQESSPGHFRSARFVAVAVAASNVGQLLRRTAGMVIWRSVDHHPEKEPEEAGGARDQERPSPAQVD